MRCTCVDKLHQHRARPVLVLPDATVQDPHDVEARVEADVVGEVQRAHVLVRAFLHCQVNVLCGGDSLQE